MADKFGTIVSRRRDPVLPADDRKRGPPPERFAEQLGMKIVNAGMAGFTPMIVSLYAIDAIGLLASATAYAFDRA